MTSSIVGIVASRPQAETLVSVLLQNGFAPNDISVLFPDKDGTRDFAHEHNTKAPEGAVAGASAGGLIGGGLGALVGIGALAIPGMGPLIAAGPLMAALSGAAAGAAVGGLTGGLIGLGIPELEAKVYEGKIRGGNILIATHAANGDEEKRLTALFKQHGATDVMTTREASPPKSATPVSR